MNRRTFLQAVAIALVGCRRSQPHTEPQSQQPSQSQASSAVDALLDLMNQRLAVMYDVARAKWNTKSPTEDAARERAVLDSVAEHGKKFALDPATTRAFFAAQIEAAKMIQRAAFAMWQAEGRGPFPDAPDLARDIRPKIDDLGRKLLAALAEFQRLGRVPSAELRQRADARLVGPGVTPEVRAEAIRPLEAA
ncbi:MAG: gamma subclass chorismate mutase AroQ [Gemmataceae bacterium]